MIYITSIGCSYQIDFSIYVVIIYFNSFDDTVSLICGRINFRTASFSAVSYNNSDIFYVDITNAGSPPTTTTSTSSTTTTSSSSTTTTTTVPVMNNFVISNQSTATISSVSPTVYYPSSGKFPIAAGVTRTKNHSGFSLALSVTLTGIFFVLDLNLYKNGTVDQLQVV